MQADHTEHVARRFLDRDEGHGARIVDLGETRDEAVAELLDRREEAQAQILRRDRGKERPVQRLVLGAHRPHEDPRSVTQLSGSLPFLGIGPDGEAGMARRRAAARRLEGGHRHTGIDGDESVLVNQYGVEIELAHLRQIGSQLRELDEEQGDGVGVRGRNVAVGFEHA